MKQFITMLLLAAILSTGLIPFSACAETGSDTEKEFDLHAQSAVLMDAASGRVLYGKNETIARPMASTTKIMTCILALEMGNPEDVVTASSNAAGQPKVHLGMSKGQTFYLKDLLYSLMLESHNDAAVAIAEHIGGSVEGFARLMNQKARDLGCADTYFITPNGLDAQAAAENGETKAHSTTARDLARIMRYCLTESEKKEEFLKITQTQNYYFADVGGKRSFNCTNHNALLTMRSDTVSGKTGFTGGAGYTYVGAVENEGRCYIIALLGCGWPPHKTWKWSDASVLFNYGIKNYRYRDIYQNPALEPIPVREGMIPGNYFEESVYTKVTLRVPQQEQTLPYLLRDDEKVEITCELPRVLEAPVEKGMAVGTVIYSLNGEVIRKYPIYTQDGVGRRDMAWSVRKIISLFLFGEGDMMEKSSR